MRARMPLVLCNCVSLFLFLVVQLCTTGARFAKRECNACFTFVCVWDVGCADDCVCNLCGCSEPGVDDDAEQYEQRLKVREF